MDACSSTVSANDVAFGIHPEGVSVHGAGDIDGRESAGTQQKTMPTGGISVRPDNAPLGVDSVGRSDEGAGDIDGRECAVVQKPMSAGGVTYSPTMLPPAMMPKAALEKAPGMSIVVKAPSRSRKPWATPMGFV